jgi:hypothetical protein
MEVHPALNAGLLVPIGRKHRALHTWNDISLLISLIIISQTMALSQVATRFDNLDERYCTEPDIDTSDIGLKRVLSYILSDTGLNF